MHKKLLIAVASLLLVGCAPVNTIPLSESARQTLANRSVVVVHHKSPIFMAMNPLGSQFGLIGAAAMAKAGHGVAKANGITDPAPAMADQIKQVLKDRFSVKDPGEPSKVIGFEAIRPDQVCEAIPGADLILQVDTDSWGYSDHPHVLEYFRVFYSGSIRLLDAHTRKILAQQSTHRFPEAPGDAHTKAELLADQAQRIKDEVDKGAKQCVHDFLVKALNIQTVPVQAGPSAPAEAPAPSLLP